MKRLIFGFLVTLTLAASGLTSAVAGVFFIDYDRTGDQEIQEDQLVGSGVFSFDGPITTGTFLLSDFSNLAFSATILDETFSLSDLTADLNVVGAEIFSIGSGFGLVFLGSSGVSGGSFDLLNANQTILTHEPTFGSPIGCCGGDGTINLFQSQGIFGDYRARADIPVPAPLALLGLGLIGLGAARRRKAA